MTTPVKRITMSKPFCALAGVGPYALAKAGEVYEDMALRGRRIVSRMSREAAQEFEETAHELEDISRSSRQQERQERETVAQTAGRARATTRA
ncbi:hypothetical protein [Microbispora bryophytorum]|uniref:YtxH domain-containing protein n=1 Tax=Microbispora bryophytorum subsp. camponoti TaxID=1677852 RepID=A0ABR8L5M6_9ACTN|nr:hypothetical protein [Microbispora camponoti]MBD3144835.1 hypothetical protein [Microbispora camponoti]